MSAPMFLVFVIVSGALLAFFAGRAWERYSGERTLRRLRRRSPILHRQISMLADEAGRVMAASQPKAPR